MDEERGALAIAASAAARALAACARAAGPLAVKAGRLAIVVLRASWIALVWLAAGGLRAAVWLARAGVRAAASLGASLRRKRYPIVRKSGVADERFASVDAPFLRGRGDSRRGAPSILRTIRGLEASCVDLARAAAVRLGIPRAVARVGQALGRFVSRLGAILAKPLMLAGRALDRLTLAHRSPHGEPEDTGHEPSASAEERARAAERHLALRRVTWFALTLAAIALAARAVVGSGGLLEAHRSRREFLSLSADVQKWKARNAWLEERIRALREDPSAIESLARERLGWIQPGEITFLFPMDPAAPEPGDPGPVAPREFAAVPEDELGELGEAPSPAPK